MNTHDKYELPPLSEPDWYLVMSADGDNVNAELRTSDEDAVNAALNMGGMVEIHRLITIDKAEAYATAAIEADRQARGVNSTHIPEGYKLVPIEPTPEMLKSGWAENDVPLKLRWKAMLEAAPEPKEQ